MDNELEVFRQAFKDLENQFQRLPVADTQIQKLKSQLTGIQKIAENLALYDPITHALNTRAGRWLFSSAVVKGMAKVDIYDLRQANKVFGVAVVDTELHKLAFQFMSIFKPDKGDYVRRSPGSDEFRIFSSTKTPLQLKRMLAKLHANQESESLLTWDFGVGLTEDEAEAALQAQRKTYRPLVIRQTVLESHSEIPRLMQQNNTYLSWNEFNTPYQRLTDIICMLELPQRLKDQTLRKIQHTRNVVKTIVTREDLTGVLNALGARWHLNHTMVRSVALTDMLDMHEGNARYGSAAIDQDLVRFAGMLLEHFPRREGFLLFRSERAGDEFKIVSTQTDAAELGDRIRSVWQHDLRRGLLGWNYGVGQNDVEAHVDLYRNRVSEIESMAMSNSNGKSTFIIVRPESDDYSNLFRLAEETAQVVKGIPIVDLHLTVQAIRNVDDFSSLKERLAEYSQNMSPFEIRVKHIARMNINNQGGRLWLLTEKTPPLEKMYNDLSRIATDMGYESYPYKSQDWVPHVKIVDLPEHTSTQIKDPTFGNSSGMTFTVSHFEWTVQKAQEHWELLDQFSFTR